MRSRRIIAAALPPRPLPQYLFFDSQTARPLPRWSFAVPLPLLSLGTALPVPLAVFGSHRRSGGGNDRSGSSSSSSPGGGGARRPLLAAAAVGAAAAASTPRDGTPASYDASLNTAPPQPLPWWLWLSVGAAAAEPSASSLPQPHPPHGRQRGSLGAAPTSPLLRARAAAAAGLEALPMPELGYQLTLGGAAGFCSGYAAKKAAKAVALGLGVAFIALQVARYYDAVPPVDWARVEEAVVARLDMDGDGRLTHADAKAWLDHAMAVLGFNFPSGAAFSGGFLLGLRYG